MKKIDLFFALSELLCILVLFNACQQDEPETEIVYGTDIYELKTYQIERDPGVVRSGWGMDMYHLGNSMLDSIYFDADRLPPWHPNNPVANGDAIIKQDAEAGVQEFRYDLLFYNEMGYTQNATGDYTAQGNPVIFIYTDPTNADNSAKATIAGTGVAFFDAFTYADITPALIGRLQSDPLVILNDHRTELHTPTIDGKVTLADDIYPFYETLTIGNKFRPGYGDLPSGNNENEIDLQPVFLIKTREGLYAKFMVTDFQGTGQDTRKLTLQWQALKEN